MDNERMQGFQKEYNELTQKWGVMFQFEAVHEQHGGSHLIKPVLGIVSIPGWQAPVEDEVDDGGDNSAK